MWSRVLKLESQPGDIRIATLCDDSLAVGISFADMVDFGSAAFTAAEGFDLACGRLAP